MRAAISGCSGFVGSHLVDALSKRGWDLQGIDLRTKAAVNWDRVEDVMNGQLRWGCVTKSELWEAMPRPDIVFHLAAQSHVDASLVYPAETMRVNGVGTQVAASYCARHRIPLVYCSTDEVYGDVAGGRWEIEGADEKDTPILPSSPYSAGKAAGEHAVFAACRTWGLKAAITRGCNAWGTRQAPEKLVPIACRLLQQGKVVPAHGGGRQVRQWIAVEDFAEHLVRVGDFLVNEETRFWPLVLNIAGPQRLSVTELLESIAAAAGWKVPSEGWTAAEERPGQDMAYHVSPWKFDEMFGFRSTRRLTAELPRLLEHYSPDGEVWLRESSG